MNKKRLQVMVCIICLLGIGLLLIAGCVASKTETKKADPRISQENWDAAVVRIFGIGMMNLGETYSNSQLPKAYPELSHGTGFIVSRNGLIVTNRHVIDQQEGLVVKINSSDRSFPAKIVYVDKNYDIAFIIINVKDLPFIPVEKTINTEINKGDVANVLGFPIDPNQNEASYTSGVISRTLQLGGKEYFQISTPVNPGNSGGPVLDASRRLVGVVMAKAKGAENYNIVIPASEILKRYKEIIRFGDIEKAYARMRGKEWEDYKEYSMLAAAMIEEQPTAFDDLITIIKKGNSKYLAESYVFAAGILWNDCIRHLEQPQTMAKGLEELATIMAMVEQASSIKPELRSTNFINAVKRMNQNLNNMFKSQ